MVSTLFLGLYHYFGIEVHVGWNVLGGDGLLSGEPSTWMTDADALDLAVDPDCDLYAM